MSGRIVIAARLRLTECPFACHPVQQTDSGQVKAGVRIHVNIIKEKERCVR